MSIIILLRFTRGLLEKNYTGIYFRAARISTEHKYK